MIPLDYIQIKLNYQEKTIIHEVIDSIQKDLDNIDTREDAAYLLINGIDRLYELGILSEFERRDLIKLISNNSLYLIVGKTSETTFYGPGITIINQIIQSIPFPFYLIENIFTTGLFFF